MSKFAEKSIMSVMKRDYIFRIDVRFAVDCVLDVARERCGGEVSEKDVLRHINASLKSMAAHMEPLEVRVGWRVCPGAALDVVPFTVTLDVHPAGWSWLGGDLWGCLVAEILSRLRKAPAGLRAHMRAAAGHFYALIHESVRRPQAPGIPGGP